MAVLLGSMLEIRGKEMLCCIYVEYLSSGMWKTTFTTHRENFIWGKSGKRDRMFTEMYEIFWIIYPYI